MQTVNFNCPHCGNLMAVGTNLLGRNVRCPHCKQVVRAPAGAGEAPSVSLPQAPVQTPAPPAPMFNIPGQTTEHHESIFGERHDEDLFGSEPLKPTMPMPPLAPTPPVPRPILEETALVSQPSPAQAPAYSETMTYEAPAAPLPEYSPLPPDDAPTRPEMPRREERESAPERSYRPRPARPESPGTPAFAWILLAYSAVITIVAGIFAYQYFTAEPKGDHPFKAIPDFYGQYEKANRKQLSFKGMPDPKLDVPADLRVKLGEAITVGDIQVRPTAVIRQVMEHVREDTVKGEVSNKAATGLALSLVVKNVSVDTTLYPNDLAFNRAFDRDQPAPYTALQVGRNFFYGPFIWPMESDTKDNYLIGFQIPKEPLGPGQEQVTWVSIAPQGMRTSGDRRIDSTLEDFQKASPGAPLLWRVQLRRGMVKAKADDGRDVDVSATAVVGVEFKVDQIRER